MTQSTPVVARLREVQETEQSTWPPPGEPHCGLSYRDSYSCSHTHTHSPVGSVAVETFAAVFWGGNKRGGKGKSDELNRLALSHQE